MALSCLGDGEYYARVVRRPTAAGPARLIGELSALASGSWARKPQTTTDASVSVYLREGCGDVLSKVLPWWDELELYRLDDLVWCGPIMEVIPRPAVDDATVTVTARDLSGWFSKRRAVREDRTWTDVDLATIFAELIAAAFAYDDPGIVLDTSPSGVLGTRILAEADLRMLDVELADLARTGVDWTVTARRFWIGTSTARLGYRLTDDAFRTAPSTRRSGLGQVNAPFIRGNAVSGSAGGADPIDGVLLEGVRDDQTIADVGSANAAAQSWWDRAHEVATYLDADNVLSSDAPIDVQQLIPGTLVPVQVAGGGVVPYSGELRLESVSTSFGPEGEDISVALQPIGTVADA